MPHFPYEAVLLCHWMEGVVNNSRLSFANNGTYQRELEVEQAKFPKNFFLPLDIRRRDVPQ